jgi:hypothetical protein
VAPKQLENLPQLTGTPIQGGEAEVYFSSADPDIVIKKYKIPRTNQNARRAIEQNRFINALRPSDKLRLTETITWPLALYGDERVIEGCKMQKVSKSFYFSATVGNVDKERICQVNYLIDTSWWSKPAVKRVQQPDIVRPEVRVELSYEYLLTLSCLWANGAFYGDISPKNLLWTLAPHPRVMFLEGDSIGLVSDSDGDAIHTTEWFPNPSISDLLSRDRSLGGLLVFRILQQNLHVKPRPADIFVGPLANALNAARELWQTGSEASLSNLLKALHIERSDKLIRMAFQRSAARGFASEILRHRPAAPTAEEQEILELANDQIAIETSILHMSTTRRNLLIRRRLPLPGFEFDLHNLAETDATKNSDLVRLISELDFESAASQYLRNQERFSLTPQLTRSLQHHLVQVEPTVAKLARNADSSIDVAWSWPAEPSINAAVITGSLNKAISFRQILKRQNSSTHATIKPRLAKTVDHIQIQWALITDAGNIITPSQTWDNKRSCEYSSKPTPSQTASSSTSTEIVFHPRPTGPPQPRNYGFKAPGPLVPNRAGRLRNTRIARLASHVFKLLQRKVLKKP